MSTTTTSARPGVREFWRNLSTEGRWLLSTVVVQTLGRGLTLPFTIIYMNEVRGISLDLAGLLMAFIAVVALAVTGPGGALVDRIGARRMLLVSTTSQMVGCAVIAFATTPWMFALGFAFLGFNFGVSWPAFNALVAAVTTGETRQQYFGINFALINLGIGVGGVIGGFYADVTNPTTFTIIFLADGLCMLVPIFLLLGPLRHVHGLAARPTDDDTSPGSYLAILRQPAVVWLTALTFLGTFVGYGQIEAGLPAFARSVSEVSTRVIGFGFAVNTATIVLLQFVVLRRISGRRRTRVLVAMCALWSVAWLTLGLTDVVAGSLAAAAGVLAFNGIFALGETLLQPTIPAITNDMAPDHLRGRYNAISAGAFQTGTIMGPVVAGFMLNHGWSWAFISMIVVGCGLMACLALVVERLITPAINGISSGDTTLLTDPTTGEPVVAD